MEFVEFASKQPINTLMEINRAYMKYLKEQVGEKKAREWYDKNPYSELAKQLDGAHIKLTGCRCNASGLVVG